MREKFFILGLPRSRTYWLSKFLDTPTCKVEHDGSCNYSSVDDMHENMMDGICDTALVLHWRKLIGKVVVIDRDYSEVVESLKEIGLPESGFLKQIRDAVIEAKKVHTWIPYHFLQNENICKMLFEDMTGETFDRERWAIMDKQILTVPVQEELERFKAASANIHSFYGEFL